MKLIIENVRSFIGTHEVPVSDFTLLVGENSTGKTTFLAMLAAMGYRERYPERPAFNEPPFNLGNFETIASRGGRRGSGGSFSIGFTRTGRDGETRSVATYVSRAGQVELDIFRTSGPRGELVYRRNGEQVSGEVTVPRKPRDGTMVQLRFGSASRGDLDRDFPVVYRIMTTARVVEPDAPAAEVSQYFQDIALLWREGTNLVDNIVPLAPIRSKPRRTYEQLDVPFRPEGDHIPIRLAQILKRDGSRVTRSDLSRALDRFGAESGLFSHVQVKRLARTASAAFEIVVTIGGERVNIADVGYGVSQVLPVVAEAVLADQGTLLLQQPEVHLHPRAQAALGTFLCELARGRKILVETHSDYLIDRVRQEVASGTVPAESVLILYFERQGAGTAVYPISLDTLGNLVNAPDCYRSFFMEEELRLLSRGDG
jgi:energy-coupling factor transporter ATP-binding protein EcfA2